MNVLVSSRPSTIAFKTLQAKRCERRSQELSFARQPADREASICPSENRYGQQIPESLGKGLKKFVPIPEQTDRRS
jgi:hypothetical protein